MSSENSYKPVNLFFTVNEPANGADPFKCPIIFVHGLLTNHRTWNFVKYTIANETNRKVYAIDLRNHGQSEYSEDFTLGDMMEDFENFMKSQNIPKAIFVAHSFGSRPVMRLVLEKPELVEKFVVEDMAVIYSSAEKEITEKMSSFIKACDRFIRNAPDNITESDFHKRSLPMIKKFYPEVSESFGANLVKLPLKTEQSGKIAWDMNAHVLIDCLCKPESYDLDLESNPKYLGNTLFLYGEKSQLMIEGTKHIALKYFPNAQFYNFKGGYHTFHVEFPDLFAEVVSKFINE